MRHDLAALFAPESVVVVGASDDPAKWGNWLAKGALQGPRPVFLVNARAETVLGQPAYPSVRDVPGPVGLAVVAVPAEHFDTAVDDALAMGATAIVGISAGLGESGPAGRRREQALAERVRAAGAVLLGPNCLGVFDADSGLELSTNPFPSGRVAFVSQSGNLSLELAQFLTEHELGFSRFASLGNQAHLDAADLVAGCIDHAGTDVIAVYCEDFRDGRRFVEAAREATDAGSRSSCSPSAAAPPRYGRPSPTPARWSRRPRWSTPPAGPPASSACTRRRRWRTRWPCSPRGLRPRGAASRS